jgi:hypothetical protein
MFGLGVPELLIILSIIIPIAILFYVISLLRRR